jgi:hypothetical protein
MHASVFKMLEALENSYNQSVAKKAADILASRTTIEEEKKYAGDFLQAVFRGDFLEAYARADVYNRAALKTILDRY